MQGIIGHPWIKDAKFDQKGNKLKTPQTHFDVLIVDEASKTTFPAIHYSSSIRS